MTGTAPDSPQELRAEIERTRAELGRTAAALAAKADVPARLAARVRSGAVRLRDSGVGEAVRRRPLPVALGVAGVAAVAVLLARRARR